MYSCSANAARSVVYKPRLMSKRSYIDVGEYPYRIDEEDPLELFAHMVRTKHNKGNEKVERSNKKLLESLMSKGQIPKSSIVWNHPYNDAICRIYGFKIDEEGYIQYDISENKSPKKPTRYEIPKSNVDMYALKNAIIKSKQIAI